MKKNIFRNIIDHQFALYPEMTIQDLYKLVYQGVMGSGHAISSEESAGNWLREEIVSCLFRRTRGTLRGDLSGREGPSS